MPAMRMTDLHVATARALMASFVCTWSNAAIVTNGHKAYATRRLWEPST